MTILYWCDYYTSGAVHVRQDAVDHAFESAFPLADAWMAARSLLGAPLLIAFLWRNRRAVLSWGGW
jgi:hypothetical protein